MCKSSISSALLVLTALACLILPGCQSQHLERRAPTHPRMPEIPVPRPVHGSIFAGTQRLALFEDLTARQVGDTLTIELQEKTDAKKSASTDATRTTEVDQKTPTLLGSVVKSIGDGAGTSSSLDAQSNFSSDGSANQSNSLSGDITVIVTHVYANGNMRIEGEKFLTLNNGEEVVRISGIVRPSDVSPDNKVVSTKIANAEIVYTGGDGPTHDVNWVGLLAKFFFTAITFL